MSQPRKRPQRQWQAKRAGSKKSAKKTFKSPKPKNKDQGWDQVASWYDKHVGADGSDYHQKLIIPAVLDFLNLRGGESVLDVCCGQGVLVKHLLDAKVGRVLGVDASPQLIESAERRFGVLKHVDFKVDDACGANAWGGEEFDHAACVMAVHDVPDARALFRNVANSLKPGGSFAIVMMHPCFRIPKKSHWGWDSDQKVQYRRLDEYGGFQKIGIETHPGKADKQGTVFYHRPLSELLSTLGNAGLATVESKELFSHRRSQVGPFSKAEHKAAEEFPLFLGLKAIKL